MYSENVLLSLMYRCMHVHEYALLEANESSRKHVYVILTPSPLKPHLYIEMGFAGVYIIFLISAIKHKLWVHVRTASMWRF